MNSFINEAIVADLWSGLARGSLVVLVLVGLSALLTYCLRRRSAAVRHVIWASTTSVCLVAPMIAWLLPPLIYLESVLPSQPEFDARPFGDGDRATNNPQLTAAPSDSYAGVTLATPVFEPRSSASEDGTARLTRSSEESHVHAFPFARVALPLWREFTLALWFGGLLTMVVRLTLGRWLLGRNHVNGRVPGPPLTGLLQRLKRKAGIRRCVTLMQSPRCSSPMTWGVVWPRVVLPMNACDWDQQTLQAVLSHELAHIRRWDSAIQLVAQMARCVFWFHPGMWIAIRRLEQTCELACDDAVVNAGFENTLYASILLELAGPARTSLSLHLATPMARKSTIEQRLRSIVDRHADRSRASASLPFVSFVSAILLAWPFALMGVSSPVSSWARVEIRLDCEYDSFGNLTRGRTFVTDDNNQMAAMASLFAAESPVRHGSPDQVRLQLVIDRVDGVREYLESDFQLFRRRGQKDWRPVSNAAELRRRVSGWFPDVEPSVFRQASESGLQSEESDAQPVDRKPAGAVESLAIPVLSRDAILVCLDHAKQAGPVSHLDRLSGSVLGYLVVQHELQLLAGDAIGDRWLQQTKDRFIGSFVESLVGSRTERARRTKRETLRPVFDEFLEHLAATRSIRVRRVVDVDRDQRRSVAVVLDVDYQSLFGLTEAPVDAVAGSAGFRRDLLASLRNDPNGPRLDFEAEIIQCLGARTAVKLWNRNGEARLGVTIQVTRPDQLAATLNKAFAPDPDVHKVALPEPLDTTVVWRVGEVTIGLVGQSLVMSNSQDFVELHAR